MNALKTWAKKTTRRKAVSVVMAGLMICQPLGLFTGCNTNPFLGLEDYQRDLLFGALALSLLRDVRQIEDDVRELQDGDPQPGQTQSGAERLSCFDTNRNGQADPDEDVNGDGFFDALDCSGAEGAPGAGGLNCWDLNGNGQADPDEDINEDGFFTALD